MPAYADPAAVDALRTSWQPLIRALDDRLAAASKQLTVAVLGGSISAGEEVHGGQVHLIYPRLLGHAKRIRVLNRAVRGTGVAHPSFCLDSLLQGETPDVVLIEYAVNDGNMGWLSTEHLLETQADADGRCEAPPQFGQRALAADPVSPLSPLASMERLVRRVLPRALPVVLYMCSPHMKRCDGLYANATRAYAGRVLDVSLAAAGAAALRNVTWNRGVHPNVIAHFIIAEGVARALLDAEGAPWSREPNALPLPPPQFLDPNWERLDVPWRCHSCGWQSCAQGPSEFNFAPLRASGFVDDGYTRPHVAPNRTQLPTSFHATKHGWMSTTVGDEVAFDVGGGPARILVAMLCSYASVGVAQIETAASESGGGGSRRCLDLCWQSRSSQQCLVSAGTVGPGRHTLTIRVMKGGNCSDGGGGADGPLAAGQVKLFGVYTQSR